MISGLCLVVMNCGGDLATWPPLTAPSKRETVCFGRFRANRKFRLGVRSVLGNSAFCPLYSRVRCVGSQSAHGNQWCARVRHIAWYGMVRYATHGNQWCARVRHIVWYGMVRYATHGNQCKALRLPWLQGRC